MDGGAGEGEALRVDLGPTNAVRYVWQLMRMSFEQLEERCGADAAFYLRFESYVMRLLLVVLVFGLAVLLPIYTTGEGILVSADNGFDRLTASNLGVGDPKLWATVASVYLNSALCWLLTVYLFRKQSYSSRVRALKLKDFTVHMTGLPKHVHDEEQLKAYIEKRAAVTVHEVVISENLDELHSIHKQTKHTIAVLERAQVSFFFFSCLFFFSPLSPQGLQCSLQ